MTTLKRLLAVLTLLVVVAAGCGGDDGSGGRDASESDRSDEPAEDEGPSEEDYADEVSEGAYQAGCIVVAAANNLPHPSFPSVFSSSLISVIKSTETDPLNFGFHFGEVIELTAPGVNIRTPWLEKGYRTLTGNSFACPHIVGVIEK